jgi:hypothetical protein
MRQRWIGLCGLLVVALVVGCSKKTPELVPAELTAAQLAVVHRLGLDAERIAELEAKPLYEFDERDVHDYLAFVQETIPDLRERVVFLGRKNIGQPYSLHLLGESPFEPYDPQPLYCLDKSDCVVFSEHTYAMALSRDWPTFFRMLQRIRYRDGQIGVATRNHYTEADWNVNNSWLVEDISEWLAGDDAIRFNTKFDRASFLNKTFGVASNYAPQPMEVVFVPMEKVAEIEHLLQPGDFVNVMRGRHGGYWAGHVGMITVGPDGTRNFLHSTPPRVVEEPLAGYIEKNMKRIPKLEKENKARLYGFKFLRLHDDPLANLREIDGPEAPRMAIPLAGSLDGN